MEKLSFQDAVFLRLEAPSRPLHVAGLMIFSLPKDTAPDFMHDLAIALGCMPEVLPIFRQKLNQPDPTKKQSWIAATDYDPAYHIRHYALPEPGKMEDLLRVVSRVHERVLDRSRPLWEFHLLEGLGGNSFALYCKLHHALIDGVGALRMVNAIFSQSPQERIDSDTAAQSGKQYPHNHQQKNLFAQVGDAVTGLLEQGRALPELSTMLLKMGWRGWRQGDSAPPLPYTAPHAIFNTEVTPQRRVMTVDLPLKKIKFIGAAYNGTVNDALIAICGGAIRAYLQEQNALPAKSLLAGIPVSIKSQDGTDGNQLSTIVCPFCTDLQDPRARLERIVSITRQAKRDLSKLDSAASLDYMNIMLLPTLALTLAGAATSIPPGYNVITSNVPGPRRRLYLNGAKLEAIYPLSLVTDAVGLNITVVSYMSKLCMGITSCPSLQPNIESLPGHIKAAYAELLESVSTFVHS